MRADDIDQAVSDIQSAVTQLASRTNHKLQAHEFA
jgi:hypothetical protein